MLAFRILVVAIDFVHVVLIVIGNETLRSQHAYSENFPWSPSQKCDLDLWLNKVILPSIVPGDFELPVWKQLVTCCVVVTEYFDDNCFWKSFRSNCTNLREICRWWGSLGVESKSTHVCENSAFARALCQKRKLQFLRFHRNRETFFTQSSCYCMTHRDIAFVYKAEHREFEHAGEKDQGHVTCK